MEFRLFFATLHEMAGIGKWTALQNLSRVFYPQIIQRACRATLTKYALKILRKTGVST
jgi:hypothetical protein